MRIHLEKNESTLKLRTRNRDIYVLFLLSLIINISMIFCYLKPMKSEIVNMEKFADYYQFTEDSEDGYLLLGSNYFSKTLVYDIEKNIVAIPERDKIIMPIKTYYEVLSGDTLSEIAYNLGQSVTMIRYNNPTMTTKLIVGEKIMIPSINGIYYKVKKGDSIYKLSYKYGVEVSDITLYNELESDDLKIGQELFLKDPDTDVLNNLSSLFKMPVRYTGVSSPFGNRFHPVLKRYIMHAGVDLRAKYVPVRATRSGVVIFAGNSSGYGKLVKIRHEEGYETRYAHLNKIYVKRGQKVLIGKTIGQSGMTGRVTGPHLHFEIRKNGKPLNPMKYLER